MRARSCACPPDEASSQTVEGKERHDYPDAIARARSSRARARLQAGGRRPGPCARPGGGAAAATGAGVGDHGRRAGRAGLPRPDRQERGARGGHHPAAGLRAHHRDPRQGRRDGETRRPALHHRPASLPGAARFGRSEPVAEPGRAGARPPRVHARPGAARDRRHLAAGPRLASQRGRRFRGPGPAQPGGRGHREAEPRVLLHPFAHRRTGRPAPGGPRERRQSSRSRRALGDPAAGPDVRGLQHPGERPHRRAARRLGRRGQGRGAAARRARRSTERDAHLPRQRRAGRDRHREAAGQRAERGLAVRAGTLREGPSGPGDPERRGARSRHRDANLGERPLRLRREGRLDGRAAARHRRAAPGRPGRRRGGVEGRRARGDRRPARGDARGRGQQPAMSLSEPFIRRPVMTVVLTLSAVLFGALCYFQLPVNDLPTVDYPVIQVNVEYPGASPETMAANVATPLERQFLQINGLELVTSKSTQGFATLTLQFDLNKSLDAAATDVHTAITQATGSLPVDLPSPPTFSKTNPNDQPIMYIALTSDSVTQGRLYDYASTQVGQRISILPGVSRVNVFGSKSAVRIQADPSAMAPRGISVDHLAGAIKAGTSYTGAGQLDGPSGTTLLSPRGQLERPESYDSLIVGTRNGAPVYLRDVANATETVQDERVKLLFWARGYEIPSATAVVAVTRQAGANAVEVAKSVRDLLPSINAELPGSVRATLIYDRSQTIVNSVKDVRETLLIAFVLVVGVIFLFLGRATDTLIPAVALPLSLLLTFIAMKLLGYSLDNLSLMALTLAIGFLVDDAIVFLENTVRRMEKGEKALEASLNSAKEISFTILSMTISLAAVFIPLVFMPGLVGRIFREFAITIVISIFASGLVSLTLTPLMTSRMLKDRGHGAKKTWMERIVGRIEKRVLDFYGRSLDWFLHRRWISAGIWAVCLAGTIVLFIVVPKTFLPPGDSGVVNGVFIAQEGSSPQQMKDLQERVSKAVQDEPSVDRAISLTGLSSFVSSNFGITYIFLKPGERPPNSAVAGSLMGRIAAIPGVFPFLKPYPVLQISTGATNQNQGQYAFSISGVNPDQVYEAADKLMEKLRPYPGFASLSSDRFNHTPNLQIDIRRDQAKIRGVSETRILGLLRNAYSQNYQYLIKKPDDQYQVILEVQDKERSNAEDLSLLYIKSDDGKNLVPLNSLVTWRTTLGPQALNHLNQFTSVTVFFNLKQGEAVTFRDTVRNLTILMLLAVFVMYVVLAVLYESYVHPLTVLSSLPVALVGGLFTLWIFHEQASLYAYVGMFMLMGIVKKNGIMIVDFALQRIAEGATAEQAIHQASIDRFRPIIMTTVAAVIGSLPIALGYGADGASRRPLGLAIVGGLVVSQFITLYITPVIYLYLEDFQEKVLDRVAFFRSRRPAAEPAAAAQPAAAA